MTSQLLKTMAQRLSFATRLGGTQLVMAAPGARAAPNPRSMATRAAVSKKELIQAVREKALLTSTQADAAVNTVLDTIVAAVAKGEKVAIAGFGTFESRVRAARKGRNPRTGEEINIPESKAPAFSAGKGFKDVVKGK